MGRTADDVVGDTLKLSLPDADGSVRTSVSWKPGNDACYGDAGSDVLVPGSGTDSAHGGSGNDELVVLHICELEAGDVLDGGEGSDVLWLPEGLELAGLDDLGVTVANVESIGVVAEHAFGVSDCAPQPQAGDG